MGAGGKGGGYGGLVMEVTGAVELYHTVITRTKPKEKKKKRKRNRVERPRSREQSKQRNGQVVPWLALQGFGLFVDCRVARSQVFVCGL